jgi:hypothetical protein
MNGKFEEKLARVAFGDASPEEARELEQRAATDPEVGRALAEYRSMQADLKRLGEVVPPDQLSKERLRDAILAGGLKSEAPRSAEGWGWVWMPVLACAAAFGFFAFRNGGGSEPMVVLDQTPEMRIDLPQPRNRVAMAAESVGSNTIPEATVTSESSPTPEVRPESRVRESRLVTRRPAERVALKPVGQKPVAKKRPIVLDGKDYVAKAQEPVMRTDKEPEAIPVAAMRDENPEVVAMAPTGGTIVLIDAQKDESTGANNATEVGTVSNVLVGG